VYECTSDVIVVLLVPCYYRFKLNIEVIICQTRIYYCTNLIHKVKMSDDQSQQ